MLERSFAKMASHVRAALDLGDSLDLHHLKYVVVATEEGSFPRAAERLKIAPSALSRRIQDLESELGVALFEGISGGIRPSCRGRDDRLQ